MLTPAQSFPARAILPLLGVIFALPALAQSGPPEIDRAFDRLYNFDFQGSHQILDRYIQSHPQEPLPYAVRASAYLFSELDRLGILESQFFVSDKRIADKKRNLAPDPRVRQLLFQSIGDAQSRANAILASRPDDPNALFAMCMTLGITSDYMALVEKRQLSSLPVAKRSNTYAQQLLKRNPPWYDAYVTAGIDEYLVGCLPFFIKWFVRFDNIQGSKDQAIRNLQIVASKGHYLKAFSKILLGIIFLREKQPRETERLLAELAHDYPANPLFRRELARVSTEAGGGQP
ncbi:MAG TPA: hypothetical protein VFA33_25050 [Bryobacteraceae bacterium]|nr:hypothetical protein [Bryobacteraceae bacterium]